MTTDVLQLIDRRVNETPQHVAIFCGDDSISYRDFKAVVSGVAGLIVSKGTRFGSIIPVLCSRGVDSVIAYVAILAAGACFVPIDIETWSDDRIHNVLKRLTPLLVVCTRRVPQVTGHYDTVCVDLDLRRSLLRQRSTTPFPWVESVGKNDLAYIVFTSGTTGKPKGVMISRASLHHYVCQGETAEPFNLGVQPEDVVLCVLSVAFDAFTITAMSTLCGGGTLLLSDPSSILRDIRKCTILPITPSVLGTLQPHESYERIRSIFLGGELPDLGVVKKWARKDRKIFNGYGATETTCTSMMTKILPEEPITLGHPISGTQVYLFDEQLRECNEGEIVIGGEGLALGYFQDEKSTEDKFLEWRSRRVYRTGDYARRTKAGLIFLGRKDDMVKNRDTRVSLQLEIAPALRSYPGAKDAIAFMHEDLLAAFVTPSHLDPVDIRRHLQATNDSFHVPDVVRVIENMPLNSNGKLNIQALKSLLCETGTPGLERDEHLDLPLSQDLSLMVLWKVCLSEALGIPEERITTQASFWDLGGNSLSAIRLLSLLSAHSYTICFKDLFTLRSLDDVLGTIERLDVPCASLGEQRHGEATPQQLQMIRSTLRTWNTGYILASIAVDLNQSIITPVSFESAWRSVILRHPIFALGFDMQQGSVVEQSPTKLNWFTSTVVGQNFEAITLETARLMLDYVRQVSEDELFYPANFFRLVVAPDKRMELLWLVHHSLVDGWSIGVLMEEVELVLQGANLPLPSPFSTFIRHRQALVDESRSQSMPFWREVLDTCPPGIHARHPTTSGALGSQWRREVRQPLPFSLDRLLEATKKLRLTSAAIFCASWAILLSVYQGNAHVVFGLVMSGRSLPMPSIERVVGPVVNTCPFSIAVPFEGSQQEYGERVQGLLLDLHRHQWAFMEAVSESTPTGLTNIFDTTIAIEIDLPKSARPKTLMGVPIGLSRKDLPEFPLVNFIELEDDNLVCRLVANETFSQPLLTRMLSHFCNILDSFVSESLGSMGSIRLGMIDSADANLLTCSHHVDVPGPLPIPNLKVAFERAVAKWPNLTAVESKQLTLTYHQLDLWANDLASILRSHVEVGDCIGLISDGSVEWIAATLAIIKVGAVYVPVEMDLPLARKEYMLKKSNAKFYLVPNQQCEAKVRGVKHSQLNISTRPFITRESEPEVVIPSSSPAYLIFTSGSTGNPKPVMIKHEAVVSFLSSSEVCLHARPHRRHAQLFAVGFDVSIGEIFGTLCYGATLMLKDPEDPLKHLEKVHALMATPSLLSTLSPEDYPNLDTVLLAGEVVPQALADRWSSHVQLFNGYGPCECTIIASLAELRRGDIVTIGRPIAQNRIYILNDRLGLVPIGVKGEICISGVQVADGYMDKELQANTRFMQDPFHPGARMYRTGDVGAWTDNLSLLFYGRKDLQVKVRGYRIELEEVENAITSVFPETRHAMVYVEEDNLLAVVCPPLYTDLHIAKQSLTGLLPNHAIPSRILGVESFQTTSNGKVDREAMKILARLTLEPSTNVKEHSLHRVVMSRTADLVAQAWKDALGLPLDHTVDSDDDFMEIGGNSLRQIHMLQKLSSRLSYRIPLRLLILNPVFHNLVSAVESFGTNRKAQTSTEGPSFLVYSLSSPTPPRSHSMLSRREKTMFEIYSRSNQRAAFNVITKLEVTGELDLKCLQRNVDSVLARHELLRTSYVQELDMPCRRLLGYPPVSKIVPGGNVSMQSIDAELLQEIRLSEDHPLYVYLVQEEWGCCIILKMHHIIGDKSSLKILLKDISEEYNRENRSATTVTPTLTYADYAGWENLNKARLDSVDERYWRHELDPLPNLPFSAAHDDFVPSNGTTTSFLIPEVPAHRPQLEFWLAVIVRGVDSSTSCGEIVIGLSHMDRSEPGTEEMIGLFLDCIPIRVHTEFFKTPDFLKHIRTRIDEALSHALPSRQIQEIIGTGRLFDVVVTYHRKEDSIAYSFHLPGISVKEHLVRMPGSRFPLLVEIYEVDGGTEIHLEYSTLLISESQIELIKRGVLASYMSWH
ncbi:hypothetical protein BCR34DRAFT_534905 [Clohesyomyces aquaticus]|uniref:Carrier domain-containing protein n=1 Tax=Clohesyomyces aquaticus TaxID=1231657 RepID=A0A1Y1ZUL0_9PLEO|nr:hypothetical protein BCR34DRAFT_534905 [Clohesyomyces aquaticus]